MMNIMNIHIDEILDSKDIKALKEALTKVPHVHSVVLNSTVPRDLMVEYEKYHNVPVKILDKLSKQGLHSDVQYC